MNPWLSDGDEPLTCYTEPCEADWYAEWARKDWNDFANFYLGGEGVI